MRYNRSIIIKYRQRVGDTDMLIETNLKSANKRMLKGIIKTLTTTGYITTKIVLIYECQHTATKNESIY